MAVDCHDRLQDNDLPLILGGTLDVVAGGRLQGNGQIGTIDNAGTIAPGNSIGTLTTR
jgi:hypothetical protein